MGTAWPLTCFVGAKFLVIVPTMGWSLFGHRSVLSTCGAVHVFLICACRDDMVAVGLGCLRYPAACCGTGGLACRACCMHDYCTCMYTAGT